MDKEIELQNRKKERQTERRWRNDITVYIGTKVMGESITHTERSGVIIKRIMFMSLFIDNLLPAKLYEINSIYS